MLIVYEFPVTPGTSVKVPVRLVDVCRRKPVALAGQEMVIEVPVLTIAIVGRAAMGLALKSQYARVLAQAGNAYGNDQIYKLVI